MRIQWRPEDEALATFIERYVDSFCTWDVLVFLAGHPDVANTTRELSRLVGRPQEQIRACVDCLLEKGLMEAVPGGFESTYRLTEDKEQRAVLRRFADGQSDRLVRMEALRWATASDPREEGQPPL